MRCQFCGQEIREDSRLWEWCGRRREEVSPSRREDHPSSPRTSASAADPAVSPQPWKIPWEEIRGAMKGDPLLLAVFLLLGFNALRAIADFVGITGPFGSSVLSDVFSVAAFLGIISWRFWAWVLVVVTQAFAALAAFLVLPMASGHPFWVIFLVVNLAINGFILAVLIPRKDYFE